MADKYTAVWVSHSSIGDFLACPRAYYLNNVYKDPKTAHKISLTNPHLALGQAVHEVIEALSILPLEERFDESLILKFDKAWEKVAGKKGGFKDEDEEYYFKTRGKEMLKRVQADPGPLQRLAVKINKSELPYFWLSEQEGIILCGKIDWLEYLEAENKVHIIDFKTGKREEKKDSLQLPIYHLLAANCQNREVAGASYWYLDRDEGLLKNDLGDLEEAREKVLKIAREIKLARKLNLFKCPQGEEGCHSCRPLEAVVAGKGEFVGVNDFRQDIYVLAGVVGNSSQESVVL